MRDQVRTFDAEGRPVVQAVGEVRTLGGFVEPGRIESQGGSLLVMGRPVEAFRPLRPRPRGDAQGEDHPAGVGERGEWIGGAEVAMGGRRLVAKRIADYFAIAMPRGALVLRDSRVQNVAAAECIREALG